MRVSRSIIFALAIAVVSAGPLFAGGSAEQPKGARITVALVVKALTDANLPIQQGGLVAAQELGDVDVIYQGPFEPSAEAQATIVNDLVAQKVNVIAISPAETGDATVPLVAALSKAKAAGIKVIVFDGSLSSVRVTGLNVGGPLLVVTSANEQGIGQALARMMAAQIGDSGEIGIVSASPDSAHENTIIQSIEAELAAHPGIRLDAVLYGNGAADRSAREAAALLKAYPDVKGIISPTPVGLEAVAKAVQEGGLSGKVRVTGLGVPADMKPYFDDGTCTQMLLGTPADVGYAVTFIAANLVRGRFHGTSGEKLQMGLLGTVETDPRPGVALSSPFVVTPDTIETFSTQ